jgi:Ca2+/Na+ antiporter
MAEKDPSPRFQHVKQRRTNYLLIASVIIIIVLLLMLSTVVVSAEMIIIVILISAVAIYIFKKKKLPPKNHYYVVDRIKKIVEKEEGRVLDIRDADSVDLPGEKKAVYFPKEPAVYVYDLVNGRIDTKEKDIDLDEFLLRMEESYILSSTTKQDIQKTKVRKALKDLGHEEETEGEE